MKFGFHWPTRIRVEDYFCESPHYYNTCADPDRGTGGLDPHKNIGFFSNTGLDPLENDKATNPAFIVGLSSAC